MPAIARTLAPTAWLRASADGHDRDPNSPGARAHSRFPMVPIVGLMTIGVILLISLLQLAAAAFG